MRRRSSQRNGSALESAARQLLRLFPGTPMALRAIRILSELNPPKPAAPVRISARCREKACPFPAMAGHDLCRGHMVDSNAKFSVLPSCAAEAIGPLHRLHSKSA
jgi:hypothetical protein